jgi:hypothetical protein
MKRSLLITSLFALALNLSAQIPTNDLVGYWPFNGNANDESGNNLDGVNFGAILTRDRFGIPNHAYYFDGTSKSCYIEIADNDLLDFVNNFSLCAWFKSNDTISGSQGILGKANNTGYGGYRLGFAPPENNGDLGLNNGPENIVVGIKYPKYDMDWHFIVGTYNGNQAILYMDGDSVASVNTSMNLNISSQSLLIGRESPGFIDERFFGGSIDDIRIYDLPLTSKEIISLFNEGKCFETFYDTVKVSVTDTLIITANLASGTNPPADQNIIKAYPNPTNDHLLIDNGDFTKMAGYKLKIMNSLGNQVFESVIDRQLFNIDLNSFGGKGLYYLQILDNTSRIIEIKKIVLQ